MNKLNSIVRKLENKKIFLQNEQHVSYLIVLLWENRFQFQRDEIKTLQKFIVDNGGTIALAQYFYEAYYRDTIYLKFKKDSDILKFFSILYVLNFKLYASVRNQIKETAWFGDGMLNLFNLYCKSYYEIVHDDSHNAHNYKFFKSRLQLRVQELQIQIEEKEYQRRCYSSGPKMSDSNGVWDNSISRFVVNIPMGGQKRNKY